MSLSSRMNVITVSRTRTASRTNLIKPIMFTFQKLTVYNCALDFNQFISRLLSQNKVDVVLRNQVRRASTSIILNIAEGSGRYSVADRRNFFVVSRSSLFECVSILDILLSESVITDDTHESGLKQADEISRMLYAMIKKS